jgi:hypothetical protein
MYTQFDQSLHYPGSNIELVAPNFRRRPDCRAGYPRSTRLNHLLCPRLINQVARSTDGRPQNGLQVSTACTFDLLHERSHYVKDQATPAAMGDTGHGRAIAACCANSDHRTVGAQRDDSQPRNIGHERVHLAVDSRLVNPLRGRAVLSSNNRQATFSAQVAGKGCAVVSYGRRQIANMISKIATLEDTSAGTAVARGNGETNCARECSIEHP